MPCYEWQCPQCEKVTTVINRMSESDKVPERCQPEPVQTDKVGEDGKPLYEKYESCGYDKPDGWKKLIGSTKFILRGYGWARDGYS